MTSDSASEAMMAMDHPTDELLKAYVQGRLPLTEATDLDRHVEACAVCGRKLGSIGSDTFSDLLRKPMSDTRPTQIEATSPDHADIHPELPAELRQHGRYEILGRLGSGGMGVVYRAMHRMMNRPVALKLIRPDLLASPAAVERFRREVQAAAKLAHANIVTAYDAEEIAGVHFLVMEYVEGKTLDQVVKKKGALPVPIACHLMRQTALGLEHAHARGMVHRDIKPQNLIVNSKSKLKILDFGLALMTEPDRSGNTNLTRERTALGTLLYAAPEQLNRRGEVDARADQYGLGATLYYLLTAEPPPSSKAPPSDSLSFEEPAPLPEVIPEGLQPVIRRLLSHAPADRYDSAKDVADALAPWCTSQTLSEERPALRKPYRIAIVALIAILIAALSAAVYNRTPKPVVDPVIATVIPVVEQTNPVPQWESLIPQIDPQRDAVVGTWTKSNGELHVAAAIGTRIVLPGRVGSEYDYRVRFTRRTGMHSVGVIFVHGGRQATFEIDAWSQHLAGFQNIDGRRSIMNPTRRDNYPIFNGRKYELLIEVRKDVIRALLDGKEVVSHKTDGRDLSIDPMFWTVPDSNAVGLVAYDADVTFHTVEIRNMK